MASRRFPIGPAAIKAIERQVDQVFDRAKARVLGPQAVDKRVQVSYVHDYTLPGLFESVAREEGVRPNEEALKAILGMAERYIESVRERAKGQVVKLVTATLQDAHSQGVKTDLPTVLGGELSSLWKDVTTSMQRIVDTEAQNAKALSALDGIVKINGSVGIQDPVVYFVVVRDKSLCLECKRLHLLEDGKTPKVWKLSEVGNGYHKKGQENPKLAGLHPHCRCTMVTLMPGYGFDERGFVRYLGRDHDEFKRQRELQ